MAASAPLRRGRAPAARQRAGRAAASVTLVLDDFHRLSGAAARESVAWFVDHAARVRAGRGLHPHRPAAAARHAARPRPAARAARRRAALHRRPRRTSSSTGASALGLAAADVELLVARTEGWPAGIYLAALSLAGKRRQARLRRAPSAAPARTSSTSSPARCWPPTTRAAGVHAAHLGARAPVRAAVRRGARAATARRRARLARRARTCSCSRSTIAARWFRFHHLFAQLLRVELERREPGAAADCTGARPSGTPRRGRPTRRSTTRSSARAFPEAGDLIAETWVHYVNAGRTPSVSDWLARFPPELVDADAAAAGRQGLGGGAARPRGRDARGGRARPRARRARRGAAAGRLRVADSSLSVLRATFALGRRGRRASSTGSRSAELRGPGLAVAARDHVGARVGALLQRRARRGRDVVRGDGGARAEHGPVDRRRRVDRRPVADRRAAREARGADGARAGGRRPRPRAAGCWTRSRRARSTPRTAWRSPPTAAGGGAPRNSSAASSCGGCGASRSTSSTPCSRSRPSSPPSATASARRRRSTRRPPSCAAAPRPGALPGRLAAARRALAEGEELSEREESILRLLTGDLTEREIAQELFLSFNTVHSHVKSIYRKLGVTSRAEAVARARRSPR